ncbi:Scr1 family TA system antitoxin-like transcriptional regulator [Actinomadura scrupuli]|uniref:Scr1 family TA system antitoxin-like transcriptional regulator n=1 Tax=Actinomadura scrupuli TaxID=559629 RepID=UPI003D97D80D
MAKNPPTIRMRRLGSQLRKIREERGLTLDEAADLLKLSKSALSRMETAQVITRRHEVDYLLFRYRVADNGLRESLLGLAAAGRSKDWIKRHGALSPGPVIGDFVRLEQDSSLIRVFQPTGIPGLLQTADYARAVIQSAPLDPARHVERSVAFRMARQEVLKQPNPVRLETVIGETSLRQRLGDTAVLRTQLRSLLESSRRGNTTVQVLPHEATRNPGFDGPFTLLEVENGDFTVVVIDSLTRSIYVEDDDEVTRYRLVFEDLRKVALTEADSRTLIEQVIQDLPDSPGRGAG